MSHNKIHTEILFILQEIQSLHAVNELWILCVNECLAKYYEKKVIEYIFEHCESFEEYDKKKQKCVIMQLINHTKQCHNQPHLSIQAETKTLFFSNKRTEYKLWKELKKATLQDKLFFISTTYPDVEHTHLRFLCYSIACRKHNGQ